MGAMKRWAEINATHLGLCVLQAMLNLERGEEGEVEVELREGCSGALALLVGDLTAGPQQPAGRWLKIVSDLKGERIVIFEIQKPQGTIHIGPDNAKEGGNDA